jgi:hypothetical protein
MCGPADSKVERVPRLDDFIGLPLTVLGREHVKNVLRVPRYVLISTSHRFLPVSHFSICFNTAPIDV